MLKKTIFFKCLETIECSSIASLLLTVQVRCQWREYPDVSEPVFNQRRPRRNWMGIASQAESVAAFGEQVNFCWNARFVQCFRIQRAVANLIHRVVPRLQ